MAINISDLGSIEEAPERSDEDDEEATMPPTKYYKRRFRNYNHEVHGYGGSFESYNRYMLQYEHQMKRYRKNLSRRQDILDYYQQPLHDLTVVRAMVDNVLLRLDQVDRDYQDDVLELLRINFTQGRNSVVRQRAIPAAADGTMKKNNADTETHQQPQNTNHQVIDGVVSLTVAGLLLYIGLCLMRGEELPQPLLRILRKLSVKDCLRVIFMVGMWPIGLVVYWLFEAYYGDPISLIQQEPGMRRMKLTVIAEVEDAEVEEWFDPEEIF